MRILFLDCDGVLNRQSSFYPTSKAYQQSGGHVLEPELVNRLVRIVGITRCKVVLSSSWRLSWQGREAVQDHIELLDVTPHHPDYIRGYEVRRWLQQHPEVERYAILDDNSDFYGSQHLFQTTFKEGLTEEITNNVINFLNGVEYGQQRIQNDGELGSRQKGTGPTAPSIGGSA